MHGGDGEVALGELVRQEVHLAARVAVDDGLGTRTFAGGSRARAELARSGASRPHRPLQRRFEVRSAKVSVSDP